MQYRRHTTKAAFVNDAADVITGACHTKRGVAIALSGGHAPIPVFNRLTQTPQFHNDCHVTFFQVDERYVPSTDPASNQRMIHEHLVQPLQAYKDHDPVAGAYFFDTSLPIQKALDTYEQLLQKRLETHGYTFDLCVLGIGAGGHTASLFAGNGTLESSRLVAHTTTDTEVHDRLTITFPAIMQSKQLLVLLQGKGDRATVKELREGTMSVREFPAKKLLEHSQLTILFGDY